MVGGVIVGTVGKRRGHLDADAGPAATSRGTRHFLSPPSEYSDDFAVDSWHQSTCRGGSQSAFAVADAAFPEVRLDAGRGRDRADE